MSALASLRFSRGWPSDTTTKSPGPGAPAARRRRMSRDGGHDRARRRGLAPLVSPCSPVSAPAAESPVSPRRLGSALRARARELKRGTATQRDYGARWQRQAKAIIARDPMCVLCGVQASREADNIKCARWERRPPELQRLWRACPGGSRRRAAADSDSLSPPSLSFMRTLDTLGGYNLWDPSQLNPGLATRAISMGVIR